jgi:tripartite-type tricarboxylate transporter receptor subunit TctC
MMSALRGLVMASVAATHTMLVCTAGAAQAQQKYPTRPVRLVLAFGPGSATDITSRLIATKISDVWKQPIVYENRTGGGGSLAAAIVAKATPDGYTLLATSAAFAIAAALRTDLTYDPIKSFAGVSEIGYGTGAIIASPSLGVRTVPELVALAQAKPGFLLFGTAGAGSGTHMSAERFKFAAGIKAQHVAFKGQPEFIIEIMAGRIHFASSGLVVAMPFIRDGKLIALVINRPERSPLLPDVPAAPEIVPGWGRDGSLAWLAPAGTPMEIRNRISEAMRQALAHPDVKERLDNLGFTPAPSTPQEHDKNLRADIEAFTRVGQQIGLRSNQASEFATVDRRTGTDSPDAGGAPGRLLLTPAGQPMTDKTVAL